MNDIIPSGDGKNGEEGRDVVSGRFVKGWKGGPGNPHHKRMSEWRSAFVGAVTPEDVHEVIMEL